MKGKYCCESGHAQVRVIDNQVANKLRSLAQSGVRLRENMVDKTFIIGSRALSAAGTEDGSEGCVTVPIFGIPIRICWEFEQLSVHFPKVNLAIKLVATVGDTEYLSGVLRINCPDIAQPAQCEITFATADRGWFDPDCDWGCFRMCAPGCVTCGTNYWCWAGCAVACVTQCCSF